MQGERLAEGPDLLHIDKWNHRGTHFSMDENTDDFCSKEGESIEISLSVILIVSK